MPLSKDENWDKTAEYCSRCYQNGAFTEPDITVEQMIEKVKGKMKEMHFPGFMANAFTKDIPKLKRWAGY